MDDGKPIDKARMEAVWRAAIEGRKDMALSKADRKPHAGRTRKLSPLTFRVSKEERREIQRRALEAKLERSEYIRRAALGLLPTGWEDLRPEVQRFALLMEEQLRKNDHKGGWQHELAADLFTRIKDETEELGDALRRGPGTPNPFGPYDKPARKRIGHEAADVANFCMMVADVVGAIPGPTPR